jgi:hypothetical protein
LHKTIDNEPAVSFEVARPLGNLELQAAPERQVDVEANDIAIAADPVGAQGPDIAKGIHLYPTRQVAEHAREQRIARFGPLDNDGTLTHDAL